MRLLTRLFSVCTIRISDGTAHCIKGKKTRRLLSEISSLADEHGIQNGEIWIDQLGLPAFSNEIPEKLHQQMRNMLAEKG